MTKINYSCYWHTNTLGYREIQAYQPWNTPIVLPNDQVIAKLRRLYDRLSTIEDIMYDEGLYDISDCGQRILGEDYYPGYYNKRRHSEYELSLLNDYEEYSHKLATYELDIKATLDEMINSISLN